jgi:SAM-dependent methyltransferase
MIEQCRVCGGSNLVEWMRDGRHRDCLYFRCRDCGLWNYDLDCGLDQGQYTEVYRSPTDADWKQNAENRKAWEALSGFLGEPGSLLDIGCGNGCLMYQARAAGWEVEGLELSDYFASEVAAETGMTVRVGNFLVEDSTSQRRFDVVVLRHVLEHLPDPHVAMQRIRDRLKPGGHAYLEFPNTGSASYAVKRVLKNLGLRNRKYSADWRPGHCNEYDRRAFTTLLGHTGFELVAWQTYSHSPVGDALYRFLPVGSKARALIRRTNEPLFKAAA